jgi:hypothetical protein
MRRCKNIKRKRDAVALCVPRVDRDSSVGIVTCYGLGIEFRWGQDFPHPSRPSVGLT